MSSVGTISEASASPPLTVILITIRCALSLLAVGSSAIAALAKIFAYRPDQTVNATFNASSAVTLIVIALQSTAFVSLLYLIWRRSQNFPITYFGIVILSVGLQFVENALGFNLAGTRWLDGAQAAAILTAVELAFVSNLCLGPACRAYFGPPALSAALQARWGHGHAMAWPPGSVCLGQLLATGMLSASVGFVAFSFDPSLHMKSATGADYALATIYYVSVPLLASLIVLFAMRSRMGRALGIAYFGVLSMVFCVPLWVGLSGLWLGNKNAGIALGMGLVMATLCFTVALRLLVSPNVRRYLSPLPEISAVSG